MSHDTKAMGKFIARLFFARDIAHVLHLRTTSFACHSALDGFYTNIVGLADGLAEQCQGECGELLDIPLRSMMLDTPSIGKDVEAFALKFVEGEKDWIENNRYDACEKDETAIQNTIDEIVGLFQTTLYKLRFLK